MATYSPTYRAIAAQFLPLQHGHGNLLRSNPALVGSAEPVVVLANVLAYHNLYWVVGPAFAHDEAGRHLFQRTVLAGTRAVADYNEGQPIERRIFCRPTHAAALDTTWDLVSAHYAIPDALAQVQHENLRRSTDAHRAQEEKWAAELAEETESERQALWNEMQPELAAEARANRLADAEEVSGSCVR